MGDDDKKKSGGKIDRLIMGIILGGAVGSVIGMTVAPRKGKETRELIKQKGKDFIRDHRETYESVKYHFKKKEGFLRWVISLIRKRKQDNQPMPRATMELPDESVEK